MMRSRRVQPPDAANRMSGGVGEVTGAILSPRPDRTWCKTLDHLFRYFSWPTRASWLSMDDQATVYDLNVVNIHTKKLFKIFSGCRS
jgi:hypothetical protein